MLMTFCSKYLSLGSGNLPGLFLCLLAKQCPTDVTEHNAKENSIISTDMSNISKIQLINLTKTYPSPAGDVTALENIDLTIPDGSVFGIIGLSGAGKSTLVRCINLLERPTSGQVLIDGEDITKLPKKKLLRLRRNIGMIFQGFNLLEQRTVEANVRFPLELDHIPRDKANARVAELLEMVGLSDKAKSYPSQLSGGQKQRVAIARALATNPKYVLCDEATSALDPTTTESILGLIKDINRKLGVTVVVITHEMRVVESICTHVAVIDNSRIAEVGLVSEVFSFPQSEIAKQLIIPNLIRSLSGGEGTKLRLVFNGDGTDEPIISALAMECRVAANILYADTKNIDGKTFGHMVITVPEETTAKVKEFLDAHNVSYKEE